MTEQLAHIKKMRVWSDIQAEERRAVLLTPDEAVKRIKAAPCRYQSFFLSGFDGLIPQIRRACESHGLAEATNHIIEMLRPHYCVVNLTGNRGDAVGAIWNPLGYDKKEIVMASEAVRRIRHWCDTGEDY